MGHFLLKQSSMVTREPLGTFFRVMLSHSLAITSKSVEPLNIFWPIAVVQAISVIKMIKKHFFMDKIVLC